MKKLRDATLISSPDYLQFIEELKVRVISARITAARAITHEVILLYWDIGSAFSISVFTACSSSTKIPAPIRDRNPQKSR
jgi:hypothetical protein